MGVTIYRRMLEYVKPYVPKMILAVLFMIGVSGLQGAIAFLVKPALDDIFIKKDTTQLTWIPLIVMIVYLLKGFCDFAQNYMMSGVGQRVIRDIRDHLYRHMQSLSLSFYMRNPTGVLMSRVTNDVGLMQGAITDAATGLVKDVFSALALICVVFYRDWRLAFVALVFFPLAFWPIARFGRKLRRTSTKTQEITGGLTSHLHETISGAKLVKAFGAEDYEVERFTIRNADLYKLSMKVVKVQAMTAPLSEVFAGMGAAAVIFYGGYSVVKGHSSPGNFFSFMTALFMLYEPVKRLSRINNVIQQGIAAATRVFEVLDTQPDVADAEGAPALPPIARNIEFDHVDFRYLDSGDYTLNDICIDVPVGTMVAIVGSSGAGKSTLVDLIPRFYDPDRGSIRIDGRDIRDFSLSSLRDQVGIVSQHTILFNDSIRYNIAYGMKDAPIDAIEDAARKANAHTFISRFTEGYDTAVGEQGMKLSGGERQRVAIARALLKNAPILILDEATSALDSESEAIVQEALDTLMQGRTTFVIAHRLSTVRNADVILVVEDGKIVERGTHQQLLAGDTRYRLFHLKQFEERKSGGQESAGEPISVG
ncbi:MAG TPA: lipid A export permease/ATP-binding protein MsbA [Candidatus Deferrimicrobiaceae bacterium]|jgi:subfamily B ATP-binding cassette protein MsbA